MYHVVLPWDRVDGVLHHEGGHWYSGDLGETLRGKLPPEIQQASVGTVGGNRDREEWMQNLHLPIPVDHDEGEALHSGRRVHSSGEEAQVGVESSPVPQLK